MCVYIIFNEILKYWNYYFGLGFLVLHAET